MVFAQIDALGRSAKMQERCRPDYEGLIAQQEVELALYSDALPILMRLSPFLCRSGPFSINELIGLVYVSIAKTEETIAGIVARQEQDKT